MRRFAVLIGTLCAMLVCAPTALAACRCLQTWPAGVFDEAHAVFQGTVRSVKKIDAGGRRWYQATLGVERAWKGVSEDTVTVRTPVSPDECGIDFWVKESYLVYAKSDSGGFLSTNRCLRTEFAKFATEDLQYLETRNDHSPLAGEVFADVGTDHPNYQSITFLYGIGLITGYRDGTFRPERSISRAELVKLLIDAAPGYRIRDDVTFGDPYDSGSLRFSDVADGEWFVPFLRKAVQGKLVKGYRDGTFRPDKSVSFAEASKMISIAFGLTREWDDAVWYEQYVQALSARNAIPTSIASVDAPLTRGEAAEILWRVREGIKNRPSKTASEVTFRFSCETVDDPGLPDVDMHAVRDAWLGWYNVERAKLGLKPYVGSNHLDRTAYEWSQWSVEHGTVGHRRPGQTSGDYDYALIRRWFADRDVTFENKSGSTFGEYVGWGTFACGDDECTEELIAAVRQTFDFYQRERQQPDRPHWNGVINPDFRLLGLGIAVDGGRYVLTTHIATDIASKPQPLCR